MDLAALLSFEPGRTGALESFVASCLCDGGVWDSARTSDGIHSIERVIERESDVLRVSGRIWEIDQSLHTFWLDVKRDAANDRFVWFLYFDVIESVARRALNALSSHSDADALEWRAKLAGEALVQDHKLVIVPGSIRALIRDAPS